MRPGKAATSNPSDPANVAVMMLLMTIPKKWFREWCPIRCETIVGTSKIEITKRSNQRGPTVSAGGKAI